MKVIEASEIPNEEKVYLKKDYFGWRVVNPYKNPETGKINWINLLGLDKKNLLFLGVIIILAIGFYFGVNELIESYKIIAANPCNFCSDCASINSNLLNYSIKIK